METAIAVEKTRRELVLDCLDANRDLIDFTEEMTGDESQKIRTAAKIDLADLYKRRASLLEELWMMAAMNTDTANAALAQVLKIMVSHIGNPFAHPQQSIGEIMAEIEAAKDVINAHLAKARA